MQIYPIYKQINVKALSS